MVIGVAIVIPVGTVLVEEIVFRGVLDPLLDRSNDVRRAAVIGAVLFGLWHVLPAMLDADTPAGALARAAGVFAATFVAGLAFSWLRRRSGIPAVPIVAHVATNSIPLAIAWTVVR